MTSCRELFAPARGGRAVLYAQVTAGLRKAQPPASSGKTIAKRKAKAKAKAKAGATKAKAEAKWSSTVASVGSRGLGQS